MKTTKKTKNARKEFIRHLLLNLQAEFPEFDIGIVEPAETSALQCVIYTAPVPKEQKKGKKKKAWGRRVTGGRQ